LGFFGAGFTLTTFRIKSSNFIPDVGSIGIGSRFIGGQLVPTPLYAAWRPWSRVFAPKAPSKASIFSSRSFLGAADSAIGTRLIA
jgi:hypothetical protein